MFPVTNSERYLVIEADFKLNEGDIIKLINNYNGYPKAFVETSSAGIHVGGSQKVLVPASEIDYTNYLNIALILDLESFTYDIYVDDIKKTLVPVSLDNIIKPEVKYNLSLTIPHILNSTAVLKVDNLKAYSSDRLLDIGNTLPNVHKTAYSDYMGNNTAYERPAGTELAKKILNSPHPRLMLNPSDLNAIKTSDDDYLNAWKQSVINDADASLNLDPYDYNLFNGNIDDLDESADLMLSLGLAYLLNGNILYVDRAYREVESLLAAHPDWGSPHALDAAEISFILSVCYDWMYDGLNIVQKSTIAQSVLENSIYPSYKLYHSQKPGMDILVPSWQLANHNWNAVCNGNAFIASVVFMEEAAHTASTLAEASLRGLEYLMTSFYPDGAWTEGADYWEYTMTYLTAALSTLEANCDNLYGMQKADGFNKTSLYSMALDGKYGVVNLGDCALMKDNVPLRYNASFMFYWSKVFDNPEFTMAMLYKKNLYKLKPTPYDVIYYTPTMNVSGYEVPTSYYFRGAEVASFASGLDANDSYIAISGGKGHSTNHDHLDSGAVIVDMKGERLFWDIGAEHYSANGYFTADRHKFFRSRTEGHNIFIINPESLLDGNAQYYGQSLDAVSSIFDYKSDKKTASINLSEAYARDASEASRTISLSGDTVCISDSLALKGETNNIYWNWYLAKPKLGTDNYDDIDCNIDEASKTVILRQNGKSFTISFETENPVSIYVEDAIQYVDTDPDKTGPKHSNAGYARLVVKMASATGNVSLKTTIE